MIEDIFAENLVDEPDDIERVIEDGEELRRDSDGGSDDEDKKKEQEEKEKEKPKIRKTTGPRPVLNARRLMGPRGIATMKDFFSDLKFDGRRGKQKKDLNMFMKRLELWTHRLFPRGQFDDSLKKIEKLGNNKLVRNYITRIRLGMEDGNGQSDVIRDEPNSPPRVTSTGDPFDDLVSSTTGTGPAFTTGSNTEMSTEQRDRMLMNRLIAEEKRAARIKKAQELKEKFKAQQAANSQSVNGEVSSLGALQMEVDDNSVSTSIYQRANSCLDKAEKASNHDNYGRGQSDVRRKKALSSPWVPSASGFLVPSSSDERVSSTTGPGPAVTTGSKTEMITEQRERMLMIAEERRAARIKKAQELKEKYKAQQAANSQSVNREVSSVMLQRNMTQEQRLENSVGALQMEVDNNHERTGVNTSIDQRANKNETEKASNENKTQDRENNKCETFNPVKNVEDLTEKHEERNYQGCSALQVEEMSVVGVDPKVCIIQEKCKHISEENIGEIKQNKNETIEEMETCDETSSKESLTTEDHIISKEEIKLKDDRDVAIGSHCKVKGKEIPVRVLKDQGENGDQVEKENENPN